MDIVSEEGEEEKGYSRDKYKVTAKSSSSCWSSRG
jgi:hypothetical protein